MAKAKQSTEQAPAAEPEVAPAVEPTAEPPAEAAPEDTPAGDIPEGEMEAFLKDEADDLDEAAVAAEVAPVEDADPGQAPATEPAAVEPAVEAEAPPAAEPPAEAPPAEATPGEAKPEAPETPPAAEPPEQQPEAVPAPPTGEDLQAQYAEWRGKAEEALQREHYLLDEKTVEELETDAAVAIPKLMSRVYLDAVTASVGHVMAAMPQLISSMAQLQRQSDEVETRFFERWPQLTDHRDSVVRLGQAYRQVFPRASEEDFTRDVGAQTIIALKIPVEVQPAPAPAPVPFTPAASSPPGGRPQVKLNPFEKLADEMAQEELDLD